MRHRVIVSICACALSLLLAACNPVEIMKEGMAHSQAVSAQLEKRFGLKSFVGFNSFNGALASVNVTFQGLPEKATLTEIADESKRVIVAEFKEKPKQIVIGFNLAP